MDDWREDWVRLHYFDEDLRRFEEAERETQGRLHVPFLDKTKVDQMMKDRNHG